MNTWESLLLAAGPVAAHDSIARSLDWLQAMARQRQRYRSSILVPDDASIGRNAGGSWAGTWTAPPASGSAPYTPVILQGPLWFPITPGVRADFTGSVDVPFASMDGWCGRRDMVNADPPPDFVTDPASVYADGGTNWGSYFVVGAVEGVTQFVARIGANTFWSATVNDPPAGAWSFQLVTYAGKSDADADTNRILVGNPWRESERQGDVRDHYLVGYVAASPQFTSVSLTPGNPYVIAGTLAAFTSTPGRTYRILVTEETDVEYAWALEPVSAAGSFTVSRSQPVGGKIKLRLVEQVDGCSVRVVGQVWAEENAADAGAFPDLRIEYRAIGGSAIPAFPTSVQPAPLDRSWTVTLAPPSLGRVSLVNVSTKRIYGEYTMPSGLMRSYIVPPQAAGQNTTSVYYDGFMDTCFLYDQAVALIALLALDEQEAAAKLVETLLLVQNEDGSFPFANNQFALDRNAGFIRNGAIAWVCYALLLADQEEYRDWFATRTTAAAKASLAFIMGYTNALGTVNGGKGQYVDGVLDPGHVIPWWSVEHNVDTWWCLDLADRLYGSSDVDYRAAAAAMETALLTDGMGWDGTHGIFWQGGTVVAGVNTPDGMHALDTHTWGGALLHKWDLSLEAQTSLARAYEHYYLTDAPTGLSGFTTFVPEDGYPPETVKAVWYEGGFGAVAAMRTIDPLRAQGLAQILVKGQRPDGSYLYALQEDTVNDIHAWPCLIASAWNIVALIGNGRVLWK